jgi:glycosyltransferase involved in cell wall biosynthesis
VSLVVADGKGNEQANGISIIDIGKTSSRIKRLILLPQKIYKAALAINAAVYHFHDPELLFVGRKLQRKGYKVIFDSHEDFPQLALQRDYVPKWLRKTLFYFATLIEKRITRKLSGVISATDTIVAKFIAYGVKQSEVIKNYSLNVVQAHRVSGNEYGFSLQANKRMAACYAGGLTQVRGIEEIVLACYKADVPLILAGAFDSEAFAQKLKAMEAWKNVEFLGVVPHSQIIERVYSRAFAGLCLLHAAPNHTYSIPIKMLEYMSNGLAVIATDAIEFCKEVIETEHCGVLANPLNVEEIAAALKNLKENPQIASQMSENGRKAVAERYNWQTQERLLIAFYEKITIK